MKTVFVTRFSEGMADSQYARATGKFAITKHFDIYTDPFRLIPHRGMTADTTGTSIGNIIVASDGNFYGVGVSAGVGNLYSRATGSWVAGTGNLGDAVNYNLLVEYHKSDGTRGLWYAGNNELGLVNFAISSVMSTQALTFTNICQGFVHPKDDVFYIGYDNKIAANNNGTWTTAALTLPANYRVTSLTSYGNYLA